ncbi:uncharacterized protein BX664DRAFT_310458 [Halteromyces radiatus]|uniref:uncharacterized protein n=1 Tax=Halteromyces radiatus TaxID=101107 RepID=UPI00221F0CD1|nr:uncharacterized protein BX664DRAFT_310458 [Halteromyces radiatus]KAI8099493.1 hypothetical protein BX664DRAFT_310458 [Halteromyces radiatus]
MESLQFDSSHVYFGMTRKEIILYKKRKKLLLLVCPSTLARHGLPTRLTGRCRDILKRAERRGELIVLDVNEYNTSKVCSRCGEKAFFFICRCSQFQMEKTLS